MRTKARSAADREPLEKFRRPSNESRPDIAEYRRIDPFRQFARYQESDGLTRVARKPVRSAFMTALSALATVAMITAAFAADPSSVRTNHAPTVSDNSSNGLTAEQENAIPYRPCMEAVGWANGRLRCRNY
jgi:hypothetical protein